MSKFRTPRLVREIVPATEDDGFSRPPHDITWSGRWMIKKSQWNNGWFCINYEALRTQPEILDAPWDTITWTSLRASASCPTFVSVMEAADFCDGADDAVRC